MADLSAIKVAVLTTDGVEQSELTEPVAALREAGAQIHILAPEGEEVQAMKHDEKADRFPVDRRIKDVDAADYDAALIPGGVMNSDKLRMDQDARRFVRDLDASGKPIAAICHAPWLLVSSGLVGERTLTSYYTLQDDIRNAGGSWVDTEAVLHQNWLTSRGPQDIPAFNREFLKMLSYQQ